MRSKLFFRTQPTPIIFIVQQTLYNKPHVTGQMIEYGPNLILNEGVEGEEIQSKDTFSSMPTSNIGYP